MRNSNGGTDDRGNMERLGESAGAMAGRAADWGMEMSGALFRSAAEVLGGWWSSDAPRQAATAWSDRAEQNCRSHFQAAGTGSASADSGGMSAGGSVGGTTAGATQATGTAPKSQHAAMQSAGEMQTDTGRSASAGASGSAAAGSGGGHVGGSAQIGDTKVSGDMRVESSSNRERGIAPDSASDGFEHARPGYQFGYVARQNPSYKGRSFTEVEPELRRVWESRAQTQGGSTQSGSSWPEVRGFVDFAYQQGDDARR